MRSSNGKDPHMGSFSDIVMENHIFLGLKHPITQMIV